MRNLLLTLLTFVVLSAFSQEDKIPKKIQRSIPDLTRYLTKGKHSQKEKATAIHEWITNNVAFDYDALSSSKHFVGVNPEEILKSKKAISNGYTELMQAMLGEAGIESETVDGYVHDVAWSPGDLTVEVSHSWVAMKLDGEWVLADPAWDAGYIGRLPIDRKPYRPKKYLIPITLYKKEVKKEKVRLKREEEEVKRKEEYDDKPQFKDDIGFVQDPTTEYFMVHPDTFLLDHLPVNPIWQLRADYVSIEDFSKSRDSLKLRLAENGGHNLDYEMGIELFRSRDFLHQFIQNGDRGFEYNPYNPGVKALNYYNFMYLVHGKKLQKYARGSIYEITEEKHPALKAVNDTIIKYVKLYKTFERDIYKNRRSFDKEKYNLTRAKDKENLKYLKKIESENEKLITYIKSNNDRIKSNLERIEEMNERIVERYPGAVNYERPREGIKDEYVKHWDDSLQIQIDSLTKIRDWQNKKRGQSSYSTLLSDVGYLTYLLKYNANAIQFKTYSNNENIDKADSLIDHYSKHAVMLYKDSLRNELLQRNVMDVVKKSNTYMRLSKTAFKELNTTLKIEDVGMYETYMQAKLVKVLRLAEEINRSSAYFNRQLLPILKTNQDIPAAIKLIEKQVKLKEDKHEYINEMVEVSHERNLDLIEQIQEDTKEWKQEYKGK